MGLYRNIAGTNAAFDATDTGGDGGGYLIEHFNPLPPLFTTQPETPLVYYDPGTPVLSDAPPLPLRDLRFIDITNPVLPSLPGSSATDALPTTIPTNTTPTQTPTIPLDVQTVLKGNILPLLTLAGLIVVVIKGDDLLGRKKTFAFVGGLGLLYYGIAKMKTT